MRGLFEADLFAMAVAGRDGKLLEANTAFCTLAGLTAAQIAAGRVRWPDLLAPEATDLARWIAEQLEREGRVPATEVELVRPDGMRAPVQFAAVALCEEQEETLLLFHDLSERRRAEAERVWLLERERGAAAETEQARRRLETLSKSLVEVQEAERRRVALELHDEIGQLLTGLKMRLEMSAGAKAARNGLDEVRALVEELMSRVRELSLDLRPAMLDDLGLLPALLYLIERFTARTRVEVRFRHSGLKRRFAPEIETAAYRIAQEALTNVARHSGAAQASLRLWVEQGRLFAEIGDRGRGFEVATALAAHTSTGLIGMRERAELLGGTLSIESTPGGGVKILAELPASEPTVTGWKEFLT